MASPMPRAAPVTIAVFLSSDTSVSLGGGLDAHARRASLTTRSTARP
jgi:hypothetical protein